MNRLAKTFFDDSQLVGRWGLYFPKYSIGYEISRFDFVSTFTGNKFDIVANVGDRACCGYLMWLNVEIGRGDYFTLALSHAGDYTRLH